MAVALHTDTTLTAVHTARVAREQAEVAQLVAVLDWAAAHAPGVGEVSASVWDRCSATDLTLAGEGAPMVEEFATIELAAALRLSTEAGKAYVGKALELKHRLPRTYTRVIDGDLVVWRAFRVAEHTTDLPAAGAAHVDRMLGPTAHKLSFAQLERTVEAARVEFDPDQAEARRLAAAEARKIEVHLEHAGPDGTVDVTGCLDHADALDLEHALQHGARQLAAAGCDQPLDVRRSMALGEMARRQLALDLDAGDSSGSTTSPGRSVVIYAHVSQTAVAGIDNTRSNALVGQIRSWCGTATKVTIKPVGDLAGCDPVDTYAIPERIKEIVDLRDHTCVFPYCTRPAPRCDHDHITPWPRGHTCPCQIAPLCRRHHRAKTHTAWTYTTLDPGTYLWHSPHGFRFLRDHHGTTET